jgi:hypothetical protein
LHWEIQRLRSEGYPVCLVAFSNLQGHARLVTTLDSDEDVVSVLNLLLSRFPDSQTIEVPWFTDT